MTRTASALASLLVLTTISGCGTKINRVNFEKINEIVKENQYGGQEMDFKKIDELLGTSASKLDAKEYEKLTKSEPKEGSEFKVWRGGKGRWLVIEWDPEKKKVRNLAANVPTR